MIGTKLTNEPKYDSHNWLRLTMHVGVMKTLMSNVEWMMRFWNNLHQVRSVKRLGSQTT